MESLVDGYGRKITNMRISVTDRCNLRCTYCMPAEPEWLPRPKILRFEEIVRIVRIAVSLGITDFRITGGEPMARKGLPDLIRLVAGVPGVKDLAMTTNGILLKKHAAALREALAQCESAGTWTDGDAARWWQANGQSDIEAEALAASSV